ncbi:MAG: hypothetical protein ACTHK8_18960 [Ginsengibacter sp.]
MFFYPIYQAIKTRLGAAIPVFYYVGQYKPGKGNTSYRVPAIYVEMPNLNDINFYPKKLMSTKCQIKIHYLSYAPFKDHDDAAQVAAIEEHEQTLMDINSLLCDWNAVDGTGLKITEQFTPVQGSLLDFEDMCVISVLAYRTEVYNRHLMTSSIKV